MNIITDSKDIKLNGITYDFSGVEAKMDSGLNIISVTCLNTGADLTKEYKERYKKPKTIISQKQFDLLVDVNGFEFVDNIFKVE